jgi:hypothetical protein
MPAGVYALRKATFADPVTGVGESLDRVTASADANLPTV